MTKMYKIREQSLLYRSTRTKHKSSKRRLNKLNFVETIFLCRLLMQSKNYFYNFTQWYFMNGNSNSNLYSLPFIQWLLAKTNCVFLINNEPELVRSGIKDSLRSHKLVFAAERSRLNNTIEKIDIWDISFMLLLIINIFERKCFVSFII